MKKLLKKKVKKNKNHNILINLLNKSKNLYGDLLKNTNRNMFPYIYGIRHDHAIINVKYTSLYLKRILKLLNYTIRRRKKILLIGNSKDLKFLVDNHFITNNNFVCFTDKWVHGFITNKITHTKQQKKIHKFLNTNKIQLILVLKSSIDNEFLNQELLQLKKPIISFVNTNYNPLISNNTLYPIVSNTKNIKSLFTLMFLLRNNLLKIKKKKLKKKNV